MHSPWATWRGQQLALGASLLALAWMAIWGARILGRWLVLMPACLFHQLTGLPCPTCGATRATLAFAQGDWLAALQWNPVIVLIYAALLAASVLMILLALINKPLGSRGLEAALTRARWWMAGAVAANWIYLLLK